MDYKSIREFSWGRLWRDGWFWQLLWVRILLSFALFMIGMVVISVLESLGMMTWIDYAVIVEMNLLDPTTAIPNLTHDFVMRTTAATLLWFFFYMIFMGIWTCGTSWALLKCYQNDRNEVVVGAFRGFRRPLTLALVMLRYVLTIWFWSNFLIVPGIVAFYRYRYLFLIVAENPDWSASKCFAEACRLTDGEKWKIFGLDCSYWKSITVVLLIGLACVFVMVAALMENPVLVASDGSVSVVLSLLFAFLLYMLLPITAMICEFHISVGQTKFYRELVERAN